MIYGSSYTPDMSALIDTEVQLIADEYGVSLHEAQQIIQYAHNKSRALQAELLASVIGLLLQSKNIPVMVHSLALAFGLNELNGAKSQSDIAKHLGVTRALVSHYVVGWRDMLTGNSKPFDNTTYRKKNGTRVTYGKLAQSKTIQAKLKHERPSKIHK